MTTEPRWNRVAPHLSWVWWQATACTALLIMLTGGTAWGETADAGLPAAQDAGSVLAAPQSPPAVGGATDGDIPSYSVKSVSLNWPGSFESKPKEQQDALKQEQEQPEVLALGDMVVLEVAGLKELRSTVEKANQKLCLFIDQKACADNPVYFLRPEFVGFRLTRSEANKDVWRQLLYKPWSTPPFEVNVGACNGTVAPQNGSNPRYVKLSMVGRWAEIVALFVFFAALLGGSILLMWKTNILRDVSLSPLRYEKDFRPPYSLGKFQLMMWTVVIVGSFGFLFLARNEVPEITPQILVLLGISASTALGSVLVNESKRTLSPGERMVLEFEKSRITEELGRLPPNIDKVKQQKDETQQTLKSMTAQVDQQKAARNAQAGEIERLRKERDAIKDPLDDRRKQLEEQIRSGGQALQELDKTISGRSREIENLEVAAAKAGRELDALDKEQRSLNERLTSINNQLTSNVSEALFARRENFLRDILSDINGISIHRAQILIWTVVLICIFVRHVYVHLEMPNLPETLLVLMGISAGTYIGFKFPERSA